jgi:protein O-GlcNAc transferase
VREGADTVTVVAPEAFDAHALLKEGAALHKAGDWEGAEERYCEVLQREPENPQALYLGGALAAMRGRPDVARELCERSIALRRDFAPAHATLGMAYINQGQQASGLACLRRAVLLDPTYKEARDNLIFALDTDPTISLEEARAVRYAYNRDLIQPVLKQAGPSASLGASCPLPTADRVLRVGYVSSDFKHHSAANASWPIIANHDRDRFEVHLFHCLDRPTDQVSERFQQLPGIAWHDVSRQTDQEVADLIRPLGIDILIDLGGFAGGNRLLVFARRPAPVQILAWGYVADTSGLSCYDALFADDVTVPLWDEGGFTERVVRLPTFMPYQPVGLVPELAVPPDDVPFTFGYLGRPHKLNETVLAMWAEILRAVPDAKLLLKSGLYSDPVFERTVVDTLVAHGVRDDRIEIHFHTSQAEHLAVHNLIDVALDPIQNGGMTTLEAALMGVPTVSLYGDRITRRTSTSIGSQALGACYHARDRNHYVRLAVEIAQGGRQLLGERHQLRTFLERSIIMDGARYTRTVEDVYRELFKEWCCT